MKTQVSKEVFFHYSLFDTWPTTHNKYKTMIYIKRGKKNFEIKKGEKHKKYKVIIHLYTVILCTHALPKRPLLNT